MALQEKRCRFCPQAEYAGPCIWRVPGNVRFGGPHMFIQTNVQEEPVGALFKSGCSAGGETATPFDKCLRPREFPTMPQELKG